MAGPWPRRGVQQDRSCGMLEPEMSARVEVAALENVERGDKVVPDGRCKAQRVNLPIASAKSEPLLKDLRHIGCV